MFNGFDSPTKTTAQLKTAPPAIPRYPVFQEHLLGFGVSKAFSLRVEGPGELKSDIVGDSPVLRYEQVQHHGCILKNLSTLEEFTATTYFVRHQGLLTPVQHLQLLGPTNPLYSCVPPTTASPTIQSLAPLEDPPSTFVLQRLLRLHYA